MEPQPETVIATNVFLVLGLCGRTVFYTIEHEKSYSHYNGSMLPSWETDGLLLLEMALYL